ncbi:MAG: diguanylate cyclase [Luteitalea sp.]|nr:diguanylate cyclase [Luteitalea sp.]
MGVQWFCARWVGIRLAAHEPPPDPAAQLPSMNHIDVFCDAPVAMAVADRAGNLLRVNRALGDLVGHPAEALIGRGLASLSHSDDACRAMAELQKLLEGPSSHFQIEQQYLHSSGRTLWVLLAVSIVRSEQGDPLSFVAHVQDFSEQQELAQRMAYLADHDALTGLFTRRRFEGALAGHLHAMARYGDCGALILLDLDRFKTVNDTYGHQAGDEVLKGVAAVLRGRVRDTDVLARLGGDEFAVILPQADLAQAQVVAADVIRMLKASHSVIGRKKVTVTASAGVVALGDTAGRDPVAAADAAMYQAKRAGGNRWMAEPGLGPCRDHAFAGNRPFVPSWGGRVLGSRATKAAVVSAAALIVASRYGYVSVPTFHVARRSLANTLGRVLTAARGTGSLRGPSRLRHTRL